MMNNPLPLALCDQSDEKKIMTKVKDDWNDVQIRCISEILQSVEVMIQTNTHENTSSYNSFNFLFYTLYRLSLARSSSIESIDTNWGWFYFGCNRHIP